MTAPGRMRRFKQFLVSQSPYRRQYLEPGRALLRISTRLSILARPRAPADSSPVWEARRCPTAPSKRGWLPSQLSDCHARHRGHAILTEPLYSRAHQLILPANSRLVGKVLQAKPAHKLHHNGELRVVFERIETSEEAVQALSQMQAQAEHLQASSQAMIGNLEGLEVARSAHMTLDEEGGARTTDSKTRYLSTGLAVLLAQPRRILMASMARRTLPVIRACAPPPAALAFV